MPKLVGVTLSHAWHVAIAWLRRHMVGLLLLMYGLATVAPGPALYLQAKVSLAVPLLGRGFVLHPSTFLLMAILFNAALAADARELVGLVRRPAALLGGLLAKTVVPLAFMALLAAALGLVAEGGEHEGLLAGIAILGSMPIAGSSSAWAQAARGSAALSVGLVLVSTLLGPLLTPLGLRAAAHVASGERAAMLQDAAGGASQAFMILCVLLPTAVGVAARLALGAARVRRLLPRLAAANLFVLLLLTYLSASNALPQALAQHRWQDIVLTAAACAALCALAFGSGAWLGSRLHTPRAQTVSLMFGLGMSNNGAGLVFASETLGNEPAVMLAIVFYNMAQQVGAGVVNRALSGRRTAAPAAAAAAPPR